MLSSFLQFRRSVKSYNFEDAISILETGCKNRSNHQNEIALIKFKNSIYRNWVEEEKTIIKEKFCGELLNESFKLIQFKKLTVTFSLSFSIIALVIAYVNSKTSNPSPEVKPQPQITIVPTDTPIIEPPKPISFVYHGEVYLTNYLKTLTDENEIKFVNNLKREFKIELSPVDEKNDPITVRVENLKFTFPYSSNKKIARFECNYSKTII